MKKLITVTAVLLLLASIVTAEGLNFSVRPGLIMQGASIGKDFGHWTPIIGADVLWISASYEDGQTRDYRAYSIGEINYSNYTTQTDKISGHAFMLIPHLGTKYHFRRATTENPVGFYLRGTWYFSIPSVNGKEENISETWQYQNGVGSNHYRNSETQDMTDQQKDAVNSLLSFWGVDMAFGAEYAFGHGFSVGGEYGFRYLHDTAKESHSSTSGWNNYEDNSTQTDSWSRELNLAIRVTYAAISLNYRF